MKVHVISFGKYKKNDQALTDELSILYQDFFGAGDAKAQLTQFWRQITSRSNKTPYTWDLFFKAITTPGVVDFKQNKNIKALSRLIESNKEIQLALHSLSYFSFSNALALDGKILGEKKFVTPYRTHETHRFQIDHSSLLIYLSHILL